MGGTIALVTPVRRDVAAVTFHGGGIAEGRLVFGPLVEEAAGLRARWLGLYGVLDHGMPVAEMERLRIAAATSDQPTEVVRYPAAGHGFHCDQRSDYHPLGAQDERQHPWMVRPSPIGLRPPHPRRRPTPTRRSRVFTPGGPVLASRAPGDRLDKTRSEYPAGVPDKCRTGRSKLARARPSDGPAPRPADRLRQEVVERRA
jgi:Dienelactone hydrolase family